MINGRRILISAGLLISSAALALPLLPIPTASADHVGPRQFDGSLGVTWSTTSRIGGVISVAVVFPGGQLAGNRVLLGDIPLLGDLAPNHVAHRVGALPVGLAHAIRAFRPTSPVTLVRIGFWWAPLAIAIVAAFVLPRRARPGHCVCGYNLFGLTAARCPKCGRVISHGSSAKDGRPAAF